MMSRFDTARKFASSIIETNKLSPPINPIEVIEQYGIEIVECENQYGIEAFSKLGVFPQITINTEYTFPARKRFTLAHELGHIIIPWHNGDVKCDTDKPYTMVNGTEMLDTQELEANIFASELLMPHAWLVEKIENSQSDFKELILKTSQDAETSVMACLYALEEALPSGNLYYVKKDNTDYWKKFSSSQTCSTSLFGNFDSRIEFLKSISYYAETFHISQYDIIYFNLLPCPTDNTIKELYSNSKDISECLETISDYEPIRTIHFLKDFLNALDDIYCAFVFCNNELVCRPSHNDSKAYKYFDGWENLLNTLETNLLEYYYLEKDSYRIVFIKEEIFTLPSIKYEEPNALLTSIVKEIYPNDFRDVRASINGVVSSINSVRKNDDEGALYNNIKYRFACDEKFIKFYNHPKFESYVVNKIRNMVKGRKNKN